MAPTMTFDPPDITGIDVDKPLIYMWEIYKPAGELVGRYVGKAIRGEKRPTERYTQNVNKLLQKRPYKSGKSYRRVHHALGEAVQKGYHIELSYLCNVDPAENIFQVEMRYIRELNCLDAAGYGLNGRGLTPLRNTSKKTRAVPGKATPFKEEQTAPVAEAATNLDHLMELVQTRYSELLELECGKRRYSWYVGNQRILRAKQQSPRGKVRIKLAVSSILDRDANEHTWDGTEEQLTQFIAQELQRFRAALT
ncbi:hypothetical protein [Noviherbaspirillum saxi]|uniref:hypothetical protein n=1 Tax=Noviherbaspirillum saxi TaxID=2320863 RepID=UPI0018F5C3EC|nr:hypothetical protein [Noviherbaspirillum saxi]